YASRFADMFEIAPTFGWTVDASFDWPTLVANKDKEIARLEAAYVAAVEKPGGTLLRDRAVLTGPNSVRLVQSGREITAKYILVATGGHPHVPDIPGKDFGITSNEAFHLERLPHSILIEGGGYIAAEFATVFAGLGVHTTIIYRGDKVLRGFDEDLRTGLEAGLQERGVKFIYETTIRSLERRGDDVLVHFSDEVDAPYGAVFFATGRRANTRGIGLEDAGVELNPDGSIKVDKYSKSNVDSIYAVGDVTGRSQLTPLAVREGWYVAETLFNDNPQWVDHSLIGTAVFSEPEVATIGLTEEEAATHGDVDVYLARFRPMINTLSTKSTRTMIKLVTGADGGKVLGLHILGKDAAELVQIAAVAIGMGATKADFDRAIAMHPTAGEELVTFKSPTHRYRNGSKV
ncbi:MAG: FAD-dependent oxidoreductase, partial [Devosia sp.]